MGASNRDLDPSIRYVSLLRLALPSILLQSGAPLAITFQTALLGWKATELVAAWAVVATATNAATVVFNFLVVGVTAKVTKVVAVGAWGQVGSRIRLALSMALVMGLVAVGMLLALQKPLEVLLRSGSPEILVLARGYFFLRVLGVPPQLLVMCTAGVLQGYRRVNLVAFLQGFRIAIDVFCSYQSLYVLDWGLTGVGLGTILASCLVAAAGFACILLLPPKEGRGQIHIFSPLLAVPAKGHVAEKAEGGKEGGWGSWFSKRPGTCHGSGAAAAPAADGNGHCCRPSSLCKAVKWGFRGQGENTKRTGICAFWPFRSCQRTAAPVADSLPNGFHHHGIQEPLLRNQDHESALVAAGEEWLGGEQNGVHEGDVEDGSVSQQEGAAHRGGETTVVVVAVASGQEDEDAEEAARVDEVLNEGLWKFVFDGVSTMLRSALVQGSFFLVLACASSLGMHAVAAHQVLMQLWMVNIYIADGFATAGTIVASSLAGHLAKSKTEKEHEAHLRNLRIVCWRVLYLGAGAGISLSLLYCVFEEPIMSLFTYDPLTKEKLRSAWLYLVLIQPLNSIVFVYDGLIYAAQAFSYMAACLTFGFLLLFLPFIALAHFVFKTLVAAWFAKGVLNSVRFFAAGYKIHFDFLCPPPFKAPPPFHHSSPPHPSGASNGDGLTPGLMGGRPVINGHPAAISPVTIGDAPAVADGNVHVAM